MPLKRLNKALAEAGIASRRSCEEYLAQGRVAVNGEVTFAPQQMIDTQRDKVHVDGKAINLTPKLVYFVLNKPMGYLCSNKRIKGRDKLVIDLFENIPQRVFTVGRLDKDTRGLLIVTNDGDFANRIIHPSANIQKEYLVKATQEITYDHLVALSQGMEIEGTFVKPVRVTKVRKGAFKIVLSEGKKREVRLLAAKVGLNVEALTRIRIGSLVLGTLPIGLWRPMTEKERRALLKED